jgi:hypothetical protein
LLVQVPAPHIAIIYVNKNKRQLLKQIVLQPLECLSSITQAKRHVNVLKQSKGGDDGRLLTVLRGNGYLSPVLKSQVYKLVCKVPDEIVISKKLKHFLSSYWFRQKKSVVLNPSSLQTWDLKTGDWWKAFTKSILEKIVQPSMLAERPFRLGKGYLSGTVIVLRRR